MFLRRIKIANFRGIRELLIDLDPTTVIIGENNYGKTSILDILDICLGVETRGDIFHFKPTDLYSAAHGDPHLKSPPIEIILTFREKQNDRWDSPAMNILQPVIVSGSGTLQEVRLKVTAIQPHAEDKISVTWCFLDNTGRSIICPDDPTIIRQLRKLSPFIFLSGHLYASPGPDQPPHASHTELEQQVEDIYRRLTHSRGPIPKKDIRDGLAATGKLLKAIRKQYGNKNADYRMVEDLVQSQRSGHSKGDTIISRFQGAGIQSISLLILVGALLEARGSAEFDASARPIVGIEEPESHLHPLARSAMWQVISSLSVQKIVTTNSGKLMGAVPLRQVRRLAKRGNSLKAYRLKNKRLSQSELRRVSYHIRARRGDALFSRCWLLVEGESEFWLLPELARVMGHNFETEGISCIEFAQCGVDPLIKLAMNFGIEWHLLVDGDDAGRSYARHAAELIIHEAEDNRISIIDDLDIELCLWHYGYEHVFRKHAEEIKATGKRAQQSQPATIINRAIRARSKPGLALSVAEAIGRAGSPGIPPELKHAVEQTVALARRVAG